MTCDVRIAEQPRVTCWLSNMYYMCAGELCDKQTNSWRFSMCCTNMSQRPLQSFTRGCRMFENDARESLCVSYLFICGKIWAY